MALPSSGSISLGQVNTELGVSATATRSLNDATTRTLFGVSSGSISLSQGYGKANQFAFTISAHQTNANLRTLALNAGWNGSSKVVATINSGIYISSNSTSVPALTVNGSFPGGVELVNNGYIIGMGGAGGSGGQTTQSNGNAGSPGGGALLVQSAIAIRNNQTIGGGGGGGGGGGSRYNNSSSHGGGGGGGGRTGLSNSSGGAKGLGWYNNDPGWYRTSQGDGAAGGTGTSSSAGAGGGGSTYLSGASGWIRGNGGAGGNWGSAGSNGIGGKQSVFDPQTAGGGGGAAGYAVSGNGNVTWLATGTRLGSVA